MVPRKDEWVRRTEDDLRYCIPCDRYLSPIAWAEHEHNPDVRAPGSDLTAFLDHLTSDVVYLGPIKVTNCASVLVIQGVEVFRLRDRDHDGAMRIDLEVRGPKGARVATVKDGKPVSIAAGYRFEDKGQRCAVVREEVAHESEEAREGKEAREAKGRNLVAVESLGSKGVRILGTFWVGDFCVEMSEESLVLGATPVVGEEAQGSGTAIVLRKSKDRIGFAKR